MARVTFDPRLFAALSCVLLGCGARSELTSPTAGWTDDVPRSDATATRDVCTIAPLCRDNARGLWRLTTADGRLAGYFATFDTAGSCAATDRRAFLSMVSTGRERCARYGEYALEADRDGVFRLRMSNTGGTALPECGGRPGNEVFTVELRWSCAVGNYGLVVQHDRPDSRYAGTYVATRCGCSNGVSACPRPYADDPCGG